MALPSLAFELESDRSFVVSLGASRVPLRSIPLSCTGFGTSSDLLLPFTISEFEAHAYKKS